MSLLLLLLASSSGCPGFVCDVWLWNFLVIRTCFFGQFIYDFLLFSLLKLALTMPRIWCDIDYVKCVWYCASFVSICFMCKYMFYNICLFYMYSQIILQFSDKTVRRWWTYKEGHWIQIQSLQIIKIRKEPDKIKRLNHCTIVKGKRLPIQICS